MPLPSKSQAASVGLIRLLDKDDDSCINCQTNPKVSGFLMCRECRSACGADLHFEPEEE